MSFMKRLLLSTGPLRSGVLSGHSEEAIRRRQSGTKRRKHPSSCWLVNLGIEQLQMTPAGPVHRGARYMPE
ncbi:MAG: hypothetical protein ACM31O_16245 [Bacteroidota bacterium]|jgi:hypothetical protein